MKPFLRGQVEEILDNADTKSTPTSSDIKRMMKDLETIVQDCGLVNEYTMAYHAALGTCRQRITPSLHRPSKIEYTDQEMIQAASWAATTLVAMSTWRQNGQDTTIHADSWRYQALSTVNTTERLIWAMERLLEESSFQ